MVGEAGHACKQGRVPKPFRVPKAQTLKPDGGLDGGRLGCREGDRVMLSSRSMQSVRLTMSELRDQACPLGPAFSLSVGVKPPEGHRLVCHS